MEVRFLSGGESPEFGKFDEGDKREFPDTVARLLIKRGLVAEIKTKAAAKAEGGLNGKE